MSSALQLKTENPRRFQSLKEPRERLLAPPSAHRIVTGDCLKVMKKYDKEIVDVIITSPPYNIGLNYNTYDDNLEEDRYISWLLEIFVEAKRLLKKDGSFFLNISGSSSQPWLPFELALKLRSHFILQNHIVWTKSISVSGDSVGHFKPISGERFVHHNHEHIFHFTKTGSVKLDRLSIGVPFKDKSNIGRFGHKKDIRCRGNTWFLPYKTVNSHAEKFNHPGSFPINLPLWCIYLHGQENSVVLDPFLGSGTTVVASHLAGGIGLGIDVDSEYTKTSSIRLNAISEGSMKLTLNEAELLELLKQDPSTAKDGGFQSFLVDLQNRANKTSGSLVLTPDDLEKIHRYAFQYKNGGWENRLKSIFGRSLGPQLKV